MAVVVILVFALPRAMPGNPVTVLLDSSATPEIDPRTRAELLAYYGLDRPLIGQLGHFLANLSDGDLGFSISRRAPVSTLIAAHVPWTLLLVGTSLALSSGISFVAGVAAAWRRGSSRDRALVATTSAVRAVPTYALASLLWLGFAVLWPVFPLGGARTPFVRHASAWASVGDVARHLVLPASALTLSLLGGKFLLVRNTMVSNLGEDYMVLARAKGLPVRLLKYRHAGRNALPPFVTLVGLQAGFAVGGAIFVESVFAYPGMGTLILRAVQARDYPVIDAVFLVLALAVVSVNFAVGVLNTRLDPRTGED